MNIGFLTPEYPHPLTGSSGGIGTSIKNLGAAIAGAGHMVSIYVYEQARDNEFYDSTIRIVQIKNVKFKGFSWWLTRRKIQKIINVDIRLGKIDILEVSDWTGISAFMRILCPVVMRLNGSDTFFCQLDKRPVKTWNKLVEKRAYKNADAIIAVSKFVGENTNNLFRQNRPFTIIPNGVDVNQFSPSCANISHDKKHILYFGTLIRKKGVIELPFIFNKVHENLPGIRLILAGADAADITTGSESTWEIMKPLFSKTALDQVTYVGKIPYHNINTQIEQADIVVFPSYAEACPVSWLEAMAMEKAIVASDIGWAPEIIKEGVEGYLVNPRSHDLYARRILELSGNATLRSTIGRAASNRVKNEFTNSIVAGKSVAFYSSLVNNKQ